MHYWMCTQIYKHTHIVNDYDHPSSIQLLIWIIFWQPDFTHMYHFTDVWIFLHFFYWHSNCLWLNVKIANLFRVARMFYLFHWLLVICGSFYEIYNRHYNHHVCVFVCIKKHKKWSLIWMLKSLKNKHEDYVL